MICAFGPLVVLDCLLFVQPMGTKRPMAYVWSELPTVLEQSLHITFQWFSHQNTNSWRACFIEWKCMEQCISKDVKLALIR